MNRPPDQIETAGAALPAAEALNGAPAPAKEAAFPALVGLFVVWLTLALTFKAHTISDSYISAGAGPAEASTSALRAFAAAGSQEALLLPVSMTWWGVAPKQALELLAKRIGYDVEFEADAARRLNAEKRSIHIDQMPLGEAIHKLMGSPQFGLALGGSRRLIIFPQILSAVPAAGVPAAGQNGTAGPAIEWSAELPISIRPVAVCPLEDGSLLLTLSKLPAADSGNQIAVQVRFGETLEALAQTTLDAAGGGEIRVANPECDMLLQLKSLGPSTGTERFQLKMRLRRGDDLRPGGAAASLPAPSAPITP